MLRNSQTLLPPPRVILFSIENTQTCDTLKAVMLWCNVYPVSSHLLIRNVKYLDPWQHKLWHFPKMIMQYVCIIVLYFGLDGCPTKLTHTYLNHLYCSYVKHNLFHLQFDNFYKINEHTWWQWQYIHSNLAPQPHVMLWQGMYFQLLTHVLNSWKHLTCKSK